MCLRGACGLKKIFGNLSADGWVSVPSLLVIWPEVSQPWSQRLLGVPGLDVSRRAHTSELIPLPPGFLSLQ